MKTKKSLSWLISLLLVSAMVLCTAACSSNSANAGASEALTEEEYQEAVTKLGDSFTALQTEAASLDLTDPDAAKEMLESLKAPLSEFIAIVPPETFQSAHEKMKSGSEAMIDYIDTAISLVSETDAAKIQEASTTMMEQLQTASNDLLEGAQMLEDAMQ